MPKVSVIIPVYNVEKYLRKCLDSVCNQKLKDIEIICVNDCSPDNSLDILNEYAENDNRIKIINFEENKGTSVARNTAIDLAQGEYIGFVDPDDYVDLDFYEKLYDKAAETKADAVKGQIKRISEKNSFKRTLSYESTHNFVKENPRNFCNNFTSAIYKTKFLIDNNVYFPINTIRSEDIYFLIKASFYYKSFSIVDDTYYYYVDNENTATKDYSDKSVISSVNAMFELFEELNNIQIEKDNYVIGYASILRNINVFNKCDEVNEETAKYVVKILNEVTQNCKYIEEYHKYSENIVELQKKNSTPNILSMLRKSIKK